MNYRDMRVAERTRYLAVNSATLPDAEQRWHNYEDVILTKFGKGLNFLSQTREAALDEAWARRDRHNTPNMGRRWPQ